MDNYIVTVAVTVKLADGRTARTAAVVDVDANSDTAARVGAMAGVRASAPAGLTIVSLTVSEVVKNV